jgi:hypothetical protein
MKVRNPACVCLAASLSCLLCACGGGSGPAANNNAGQQPLIDQQPQVSIVPGNTNVVTGDSTTLTVTSRNTLGRNAKIEWTTTGGKLHTEQDGRVARVQFDQPGAYTVTAKLRIGDYIADQDSVTINARPLR